MTEKRSYFNWVWKRKWLLLVPMLAALAFISSDYFTAPIQKQRQERAYLERQASTVNVAYREDLAALDAAPRYTISATADPETGVVEATMSVVYTNRSGEPLPDLVFRLYPNATTIYGGGSLTVHEVTRDGAPVETDLAQGDTVMRAALAPALPPGDSMVLDLRFTAQVPANSWQGYGIFNRARGLMALAGWYPVLTLYTGGWQTPPIPNVGDAMLAEMSYYDVSLAVPAGYEIASTGRAAERQERDGEVVWHFASGPAREFAAAISDRMEMRETQVNGVTLRYFTLPASTPRTSADAGLEIAEQAFAAYQSYYGPYLFEEFDVVEAVVNIGGYEFPGMVFVEDAARVSQSRSSYDFLLTHEIAHQWWYGFVGNHTIEEPWLDESMANYSVVLHRERNQGPEAGEALINSWRRRYGDRRPQEPPVNSSALDFRGWAAYRQAVYIHGALFLDELRAEIGDDAFFDLLKRHQELHRYDIATTTDFLNLAEEVSGQELDPLFQKWFDVGEIE